MPKVKSKRHRRLSIKKRLVLFDRMTKRIDQLPPVKPAQPGESRGWTREDLYADRHERCGRGPRDVSINFNNDAQAYAVKNAETLVGMIEPGYLATERKERTS